MLLDDSFEHTVWTAPSVDRPDSRSSSSGGDGSGSAAALCSGDDAGMCGRNDASAVEQADVTVNQMRVVLIIDVWHPDLPMEPRSLLAEG